MSQQRRIAKAHRELYAAIPEVEGCTHCGDCCGIVAWSAWEWSQVEHRKPTERDIRLLRCPYYRAKGCDCYEDRPFMCRLFAAVEDLRCPHGAKAKRLLTAAEGLALLLRYRTLCEQEAGPVVARSRPGPRGGREPDARASRGRGGGLDTLF